jgi:hypothetical protein
MAKAPMKPAYERSAADRKADAGKREGGKADMRADAKATRKMPQRDGLAKFARSIKVI